MFNQASKVIPQSSCFLTSQPTIAGIYWSYLVKQLHNIRINVISFLVCRFRPVKGKQEEWKSIVAKFKIEQDYEKVYKQFSNCDTLRNYFLTKSKLQRAVFKEHVCRNHQFITNAQLPYNNHHLYQQHQVIHKLNHFSLKLILTRQHLKMLNCFCLCAELIANDICLSSNRCSDISVCLMPRQASSYRLVIGIRWKKKLVERSSR